MPTEISLDQPPPESEIEYLREKGWEIEVCGGMKGNALVIDFIIGGINFPESLISTAISRFAVIPKEQFKKLEKSGVITNVKNKKFLDHISGHAVPAKIGKADIEVKGRTGGKTYQSVSVVGIKFPEEYKWRSILGAEFLSSFDVWEMGWSGDPVIGFYGCRKIKS